MTVVPQQYTLHCITTGTNSPYKIIMYYSFQLLHNEYCTSVRCSTRELLHSYNDTYDHNFNITWDTDTETISSGSFNQLTNGDQIYRCIVIAQPDTYRERFLAVKGIS